MNGLGLVNDLDPVSVVDDVVPELDLAQEALVEDVPEVDQEVLAGDEDHTLDQDRDPVREIAAVVVAQDPAHDLANEINRDRAQLGVSARDRRRNLKAILARVQKKPLFDGATLRRKKRKTPIRKASFRNWKKFQFHQTKIPPLLRPQSHLISTSCPALLHDWFLLLLRFRPQ